MAISPFKTKIFRNNNELFNCLTNFLDDNLYHLNTNQQNLYFFSMFLVLAMVKLFPIEIKYKKDILEYTIAYEYIIRDYNDNFKRKGISTEQFEKYIKKHNYIKESNTHIFTTFKGLYEFHKFKQIVINEMLLDKSITFSNEIVEYILERIDYGDDY